MKRTVLKLPAIFVLLTFLSVQAFSQSESTWHLDQGKAIARKSILMPGKLAVDIYKEVNRWLVKYYNEPEDNIKARIDGEYLRGAGYHTNIFNSRESADFSYTFIFDVVDGKVTMTITDGLIIHVYASAVSEPDKHESVEEYLRLERKTKIKAREVEQVMMLLNSFSVSLFESFENSAIQTNGRL